MGSDHSVISEGDFTKNWRIIDTVDHLTIWQNKQNPGQQLEQYYVQEAEDDITRQLNTHRRHSPYLVGGFTIKEEGGGCCTDRHGTKLFLERIPLRLSNLEDIPFPDVLHLLDACLQGFRELSSLVGFFRVDEDQVGVNERGQVKVWLSTSFENSQLVGTRTVPQPEMLQDILSLVYQAEDPESFPPNVPTLAQGIGAADRDSTFESVSDKFKEYARRYTESYVPKNLQCVHSAGGANLINDWCRSNQSYGFDQNSLRLSEKVFYQPRALKSAVDNAPGQEERASNGNAQIDSQLAGVFENRISQQQPLFSVTSNVQQKEQLAERLPQMHHRVIHPQQASQVIPPQFAAQNGQQVAVPAQQAIQQGPPPQIIQQQVPPPQIIQQQIPVQITSQRAPPQQVFIPQQQIVIPQQQVQQVVLPQQQQIRQVVIPQQPVAVSQQVVSEQVVAPPQYFTKNITSNVTPVPLQSGPSIKFLQKQPSRKEIISEPIAQNDSRLQQQRVISQTIQIKDNSKVEQNTLQTTAPSYTYQAPRQQPAQDLQSYARKVPFSVNVAEERFAPTDDGKSSPEFLALLSQLKGGSSSNYEVYSQAADTPSYAKANPSEASPKQYLSYLPQQTNYQELSPQRFQEYRPARYESSIDPELQADLGRYQ